MTDHGLFSLDGRVAVVTGAGSGIGQAIALGYAAAGAHVLVWGRDEKVHRTVETIVENEEVRRCGGGAEPVLADLGDLDAAAETAHSLVRERRVDILVNNAGTISRRPAEEVTAQGWREVTAVNLDAVWALSRIFGASMLDQGYGRIISVASMLSFQGGRHVSSYAASKHAVLGLTRALASEWASRGVAVNAIAPGYVVTANTAALRADQERSEQITARIPAGRWATPEDMVGPALFLASEAARYVHGHVLAVDGGWLAA